MSHKSGKYNYNGKSKQQPSKMCPEFKNEQIFQKSTKTDARDSYYSINGIPLYVSNTLNNCIGRICISPDKISEIDGMLENSRPIVIPPYEEMKNSLFKQNFLEKRMLEMDQKMEFFMEKMERKQDIDQLLFIENNDKLSDPFFIKMYEKRRRLPAFEQRNQIIRTIEDNQVILLSGDTGCGKTTQVPQFLLDEYINGYKGSICKIVCTQPRRISTIAVATRVAQERCEPLGLSCGYQIRMERKLPRRYGSILYVTNGIIIRHMENDPTLNNVSHLVIDEIHERDIHSDFLLTLVKQLIAKRKDLKIILMSATMNEEKFSAFFSSCPHVVINGETYPVDQYYLEDIYKMLDYRVSSRHVQQETHQQNSLSFLKRVIPYVNQLENDGLFSSEICRELRKPHSEEIDLELIFKLTLHICSTGEEGAILIFVTGYDDIKELYDKFWSVLPEDEFVLVALHSLIPTEQQKLVFEELPPGMRKVVISTNIAETSITIDDVVHVIDCGWSKVKNYDPKTRTENLEPRFISKANAAQRKGRAGRLRAGKCYRLYTKARFETFYEFIKPEILRTRLESLILQMKLLQLGKVKLFFKTLLDSPDSYLIDCSLDLLGQLGALDEEEALTPLGFYLAKLPISPQLGKMLLYSIYFKCLDPVLNIAVALDYKSPFLLTLDKDPKKNDQLVEFSEGVESDHLLLHKALFLYELVEESSRKRFCAFFKLNYEAMKMLRKLKREFMEDMKDLELIKDANSKNKEWNMYASNVQLVKSVVCAGLFPNIIIACPAVPRIVFQTVDQKKVKLHKKSVLSLNRFFSCPLLTYYVKMKTSMDMVHDATVCSPFFVIFFGQRFKIEKTLNSTYISANGIKFSCEKNVSRVIESLRDRLERYLLYRMLNPALSSEMNKDPEDDIFLKIVIDLLASPEK